MAEEVKIKKSGTGVLAKILFSFALLNLILFITFIKMKPDEKIQLYTKRLYDDARFYEYEGRVDMALKKYNIIIKDYPDVILADNALFRVATIQLRNQNDFDASVRSFSKLIEKYPDSPFAEKAEYNIKFITSSNDFEGEPLKLFYKASAYKRSEQFARAIDTLREIIDEYPGANLEPDAWYWIGSLQYEHLGLREPAYRTFMELCKRFPDNKRAKKAYKILQRAGIEVKEMEY